MTTTLNFETGPVQLSLRQCAGAGLAPAITVQLHATGGAQIYVGQSQPINEARWVMTISAAAASQLHSLSYAAPDGRPLCTILVSQSPERFAILLDLFKGGNASEITVDIEGLVALSDYSRRWDVLASPVLPVSSVCFEFPLPQSDD
jgi:hypothetical protein